MNEERIEQLLRSYGDSMGHARRPVKPNRSRVALPGGIALALVAVIIGLWPRNAVAHAIDTVSAAIENANSMELVVEKVGTKGRRVVSRMFNRGESWRLEGHLDQGRSVALIFSGKTKVVDYKGLDYATIQPADARKELNLDDSGALNALELAKRWVRFGSDDEPPITKLTQNGSTYTIQVEKKGEGLRSEIIVDSSTDLPISARLTGEKRGQPVEMFQRYRFNVPLSDAMFKPNPAKKLVHLKSAEAAQVKSWTKPLAVCEGTNVHAVNTTLDGVIWVAVSAGNSESAMLPSSIDAGNGVTYARADDVFPTAGPDQVKMFTIAGQLVYVFVVPFVPLSNTPELPGRIDVKFARRPAKLTANSVDEIALDSPLKQPIQVLSIRETGALPSYFPALNLTEEFLRIPMALAKTRCLAFEKQERWQDAAEAYLAAVPAYEAFVDRAIQIPYREAARCYRKIGQTAEAERLEALASASKLF